MSDLEPKLQNGSEVSCPKCGAGVPAAEEQIDALTDVYEALRDVAAEVASEIEAAVQQERPIDPAWIHKLRAGFMTGTVSIEAFHESLEFQTPIGGENV